MLGELEEDLVQALLKLDIELCLQLFAKGVCLHFQPPYCGPQPLHIVLKDHGEDGEAQQVALAQLLLLNGADPNLTDNLGQTVLDLALELGRIEVVILLQSWGAEATQRRPNEKENTNVSVKFRRYVLEDGTEGHSSLKETFSHGKEFLQQVANIFQDQLSGSPAIDDTGDGRHDGVDLLDVFGQLASAGFTTPVPSASRSLSGIPGVLPNTKVLPDTLVPNATGANTSVPTMIVNSTKNCSDMPDTIGVSAHQISPPGLDNDVQMDISQISSIQSLPRSILPSSSTLKKERLPNTKLFPNSSTTSTPRVPNKISSEEYRSSTPRKNGPKLDISQISSISSLKRSSSSKTSSCVVSSAGDFSSNTGDVHSFHACSTTEVNNVTLALANSKLSIAQEFVIHDEAAGVSLLALHRSSLLSIAVQDQCLVDRIQSKIEDSGHTSNSIQMQRSYLRVKHKLRANVTEESRELDMDSKYPKPISMSFNNVSYITKKWVQLSDMENQMSKPFRNLSDTVTNTVNMLTRESACKSSFNYLLLDPRITENLPMKVFIDSDQTLWRNFVPAVFYVGKGSRSRPFQHLYEAVKVAKNEKKKISEKISKIRSIWSDGLGVVLLQCFHNTIAVEAFTREAAMIDAIGCDNLTNVKGGDYYGTSAQWSVDMKLEIGTFLLYKSFKIFLQEGERQIRPVDLKT